MLARLDSWIAHHMAIVSPSCLVTGILLAPWIESYQWIVPYLFAFMTFQSSLGSGFKEVSGAFRKPLPILAALFGLHVVMPCVVCAIGTFLFRERPEIVTGMVLEFSVPTGIITLIWISIVNGNSALTLSIVFLDTVLAPLVVPLALTQLVGADVRIDSTMALRMMRGLTFMVALPALLAVTLNQLTKGRVKTVLMPRLSLATKFGFIIIITLNSTGLHEYVLVRPEWKLFGVVASMGVLAVIGFVVGAGCARLLRADRATSASLILGVGMRNISAGATIAAAYFPGQAVILPIMIATLFQQILAATVGLGLIRRAGEGKTENDVSRP